jgi:small subunit ribosomal protein S5
VAVDRVRKVVKGGKILSFRAVVVASKGRCVGVGKGKARDVVTAIKKGGIDAAKCSIEVPLTRSYSISHPVDGHFGAAKVMLRPASPGSGVIAGGSIRVVLEAAGIKNILSKQLGSGNLLNNARATLNGLKALRVYKEYN